jgi:hypothetical protein
MVDDWSELMNPIRHVSSIEDERDDVVHDLTFVDDFHDALVVIDDDRRLVTIHRSRLDQNNLMKVKVKYYFDFVDDK